MTQAADRILAARVKRRDVRVVEPAEFLREAEAALAAGVELNVICPRSNSPVRLVIDILELERLVCDSNDLADCPGGVGSRRVLPTTRGRRDTWPWREPRDRGGRAGGLAVHRSAGLEATW